MNTPAIRVDSLSKLYKLGAAQSGYKTLRETIVNTCGTPWRRLRNSLAPSDVSDTTFREHCEDFWALQDVSFDVQQGEVVGIIGRNGAGKSTLLKILSRITEPTSGRIELRGRVGSLLEVGTGFHPELTGRENIYMNGSILGMSRRDIHRQFDDIVAFAEVEEFLDTPVKRYSSGMYVRLAFAVAAHLEPEILIIDEVLAVGDAAFQKKCLGKMHDVAGHGRTVLFVSHNMAAVQNLCNRLVVLEKGRNAFVGSTAEGVSRYHSSRGQTHDGFLSLLSHPARRIKSAPLLQSVRLLGEDGLQRATFATGERIYIEFQVAPVTPLREAQFGIGFDSSVGTRVFSLTTHLSAFGLQNIETPSVVRCSIAELPLAPGRYFLSLSAGTRHNSLIDAIDDAIYLDVEPSDYYGNGAMPSSSLGNVVVRSLWAAEAIV